MDHIKDVTVVSKKTFDSGSEKIAIAFKFKDGVKKEQTFSQTSTVKVCVSLVSYHV